MCRGPFPVGAVAESFHYRPLNNTQLLSWDSPVVAGCSRLGWVPQAMETPTSKSRKSCVGLQLSSPHFPPAARTIGISSHHRLMFRHGRWLTPRIPSTDWTHRSRQQVDSARRKTLATIHPNTACVLRWLRMDWATQQSASTLIAAIARKCSFIREFLATCSEDPGADESPLGMDLIGQLSSRSRRLPRTENPRGRSLPRKRREACRLKGAGELGTEIKDGLMDPAA